MTEKFPTSPAKATQDANKFPQQAVGVFDSGLGGLSIARCITENLPNEQLIYVSDHLFAPYGDKSSTVIIERVNKLADWLINQNVKVIVVACNTATVIAIEQLRLRVSIPVIGVEPAIKPAAIQSKSKKVALLVTEATAVNQRFLALIALHKNGSDVFIQPCPGLVELIELGLHKSEQCRQLLQRFLQPLLQKNIDTLVLGCTHYPFVRSLIQEIVGNKITIMETAQPVTEQLIRKLKQKDIIQDVENIPQHTFYSSRMSQEQTKLMSELFGQDLSLEQLPLI
jgi:glutamate racemase